MFDNGVVGDENYLDVSEVFVERAGWNRTDCVTYSDVGNILPHGIDNPGSIISQTCWEFYRWSARRWLPGVSRRCLERWRTHSIPIRRHTNPLLAFSRIGCVAWYASE